MKDTQWIDPHGTAGHAARRLATHADGFVPKAASVSSQIQQCLMGICGSGVGLGLGALAGCVLGAAGQFLVKGSIAFGEPRIAVWLMGALGYFAGYFISFNDVPGPGVGHGLIYLAGTLAYFAVTAVVLFNV